ncbi:hypothetical protein [Hymenobacter armeniacus]|uniref:CBM-cenC domain-containing protein n=1 Tax=Hymenobacter armeniacus TaxID=2771358 RepID=A0ABR8JXB6_9BACT|nr:hypothetical protein [Hymenobacter armeniacus]MBD2723438.1 hypothetical protein [Hymenobacter armeniacus]
MRNSIFLTALSLLAACRSDSNSAARSGTDASVLATADFEQSIGWGNADAASLTTEKAHSGQWSVRVKPEVAFSYTYSRQLRDLSPTPLTRLVLEGQVLRVAAGSTAKLVVQVNASPTDDTKVFYAALPVEQDVPKFGEWTAVRLPINLPTSATGANNIKIYLWNDQGTAPTYLDDVRLRKAE